MPIHKNMCRYVQLFALNYTMDLIYVRMLTRGARVYFKWKYKQNIMFPLLVSFCLIDGLKCFHVDCIVLFLILQAYRPWWYGTVCRSTTIYRSNLVLYFIEGVYTFMFKTHSCPTLCPGCLVLFHILLSQLNFLYIHNIVWIKN